VTTDERGWLADWFEEFAAWALVDSMYGSRPERVATELAA
jgi:hypothetical protein